MKESLCSETPAAVKGSANSWQVLLLIKQLNEEIFRAWAAMAQRHWSQVALMIVEVAPRLLSETFRVIPMANP